MDQGLGAMCLGMQEGGANTWRVGLEYTAVRPEGPSKLGNRDEAKCSGMSGDQVGLIR